MGHASGRPVGDEGPGRPDDRDDAGDAGGAGDGWDGRDDERGAALRSRASAYATTGLAVVTREYPNHLRHTMAGPDDRPRPREVHPAFYGSFDWHSSVEMHWMLVRLLRTVPGAVAPATASAARAVLDEHLDAAAIEAEAAYLAAHPGFERPYGWGWALRLAHETAAWDDDGARRWSAALAPLAGVVTRNLLDWLPKARYPDRYGMHGNGAFGLSLAWPHAEARDATLLDALRDAAVRWFAADEDYPGGWEPSGSDFLSPALVEAELMSRVLAPAAFAAWFERFLPGVADGRPPSLFTPAVVSDSSDGQIAHLHGLNLSRAWAWRRLAAALGPTGPAVAPMVEAARRHADVALDEATGGDYMVEHWLAAYAVRYLTSSS